MCNCLSPDSSNEFLYFISLQFPNLYQGILFLSCEMDGIMVHFTEKTKK